MKTKILPAIVTAIIFSSCSSAYKATQTPDDLYYSPAKEVTVSTETKREKKKEEIIREEDYTSYNDRFIRMKIANRRWSSLDDYAYWNDSRFSTSCNCTCNTLNFVWFDGRYYPVRNYGYTYNNPFNPYGTSYYNSWNNPYYYPITYIKTVASAPSARPSRSLVETYKNTIYDNKNRPVFEKGRTIYSDESSNPSLLKRVFSSSGTQVDRASRTFDTNTTTTNSSNNNSSSNSSNTNSNAGGRSSGYNSTGTSTSTARPPRNQ